MTEAEWLACPDARDLLYLSDLRFEEWPDDRTPRLLACAACRLLWDSLTDPRSRAAIEQTERYCDDEITRKALKDANRAAMAAYREARNTRAHHASWAASKASRPIKPMGGMLETLTIISSGEDNPWCGVLAVIIRDVFGVKLFRPVAFDPRWRTSSVVSLSQAIYETRSFDRMPILANELVDAGCDNGEILDHCREDGPHVRGCWLIDLILGKGNAVDSGRVQPAAQIDLPRD